MSLSQFIRRWQPPLPDRRVFAAELAALLAETRRDERSAIVGTNRSNLSRKLQKLAEDEPETAEALARFLS